MNRSAVTVLRDVIPDPSRGDRLTIFHDPREITFSPLATLFLSFFFPILFHFAAPSVRFFSLVFLHGR